MKPLLSIPENLLQENNILIERVIELYERQNFEELNKVPAMIDQDGRTISFFGDNTWDLSCYIDAKVITKRSATFNHLESKSLLFEQKLLAFLSLYAVGSFRKGMIIKPTTFLNRNMHLTQIYKFLESVQAKSICFLNHPIQFSRYCEHIKSLKMSASYISKIFSVINWIEALSEDSPIKLRINKEHNREIGRKLGCPSKLVEEQYYAIPSRLMQLIYSKAIKYIEDYHPIRHLLLDINTELYENYQVAKLIVDNKISSGQWNWITKSSPQYRIEVSKATPQKPKDIINSYIKGTPYEHLISTGRGMFANLFTHLQVCCFAVCGAFTGMRRSEIFGIHENSFKTLQLNEQTYYSVQSLHSKMTPAVAEKVEWLTSPITKKAIELAATLTQHMRTQLMLSANRADNEIASSIWLIQRLKSKMPNILGSTTIFLHYKQLVTESNAIVNEEDYEEFAIINPNLNIHAYKQKIMVGKPWALTTHQLRRTFAVFGKRHNLLSDVAIKQQYKHLYLPMAQWYAEGGIAAKIKRVKVDSELNNLLQEVDREVTTQLLFQWYNSDDKLFGKKGIDVVKDRQNNAVKYSSWDALYAQVSAGRVSIVGTLHSYCMAGYECRMEKVVSPTNCFNCENVVIDETKAQAWQKRHLWIVETITEMEEHTKLSQSQLSHFITQLRAAEKVMDYFDISYTPYKPEIEIRQI
ncbi:integrase [Pseudoalteromonas sp. CO342X]|uniref:integrase n=1 Tax=Pseudoalteromonas sp. CO342X TaxID=1777270 RepID=UPI001023E90A|nr:integrase [Pseudoalteromonas sp. CO342X]RZG13763.1 integrase [Pseudoalteromonas sp. CO342X]